jgi:FkbM family methyltransferase
VGCGLTRTLGLLVGDRGRIRDVSFVEGGIEFRCRVNEDNLLGCREDNLLLGEYEREGIQLPDFSGVVVDAGAHVGLFTLLASAHARQVVAIEAHPDNYELLEDSIEGNQRGNVVAQHSALWSTNGTTSFVEGPATSAGSVLGEGGRRISVPSVTLDSVIASTGPVDLLKLDVEGAEFDVLDSASDETLRQVATIEGELHLTARGDRLFPTMARLRAPGFTVAVRRPPIFHWRESMRALWRNRRRLRRDVRLRLSVPALYSIVALGDPLLHLRERLDGESLAFIYTMRAPPRRGP